MIRCEFCYESGHELYLTEDQLNSHKESFHQLDLKIANPDRFPELEHFKLFLDKKLIFWYFITAVVMFFIGLGYFTLQVDNFGVCHVYYGVKTCWVDWNNDVFDHSHDLTYKFFP